jgi:formylglycine-generating enzyme required for sulfatase activity
MNGCRGLANAASPGTYETGWVSSDDANLGFNNGGPCALDVTTWMQYSGNENLPINCVNWSTAYAFCIWDGGFLPSEAEWEYAAAGGNQQRLYPWGSTPPGTSNQYAIYNCYYPNETGNCVGTANIAPVGTALQGAGRWGQLDLVGEMGQWNMDWFSSNYVNPCTDCAYLAMTVPAYQSIRGSGSFAANPSFPTLSLLATARSNHGRPDGDQIGIRCARSP